MRLRKPTVWELISVIALVALLAAGGWYLNSASSLLGEVELSTNGQIARALGIGIAVVLAIVLNTAFIVLARKQSEDSPDEAAGDSKASTDPFRAE
jgi:protein-S-isoprenylcysteine O-methyltransferase Ste14